jgi:hypothetical protein
LWQVSAGPEGEVVFTRAVAIGLFQQDESRLAAPMVVGEHISVPDGRPNHIGYADSEDPLPWVEQCKARRAEMVKKEAEQVGKPKLWTPDEPKVAKFN